LIGLEGITYKHERGGEGRHCKNVK
jgi:hypothetical protein